MGLLNIFKRKPKENKFIKSLKQLSKDKELIWDIEIDSEDYYMYGTIYAGHIFAKYTTNLPDGSRLEVYKTRSSSYNKIDRYDLYLRQGNTTIETYNNVIDLYTLVDDILHEDIRKTRLQNQEIEIKTRKTITENVQSYIINLCKG